MTSFPAVRNTHKQQHLCMMLLGIYSYSSGWNWVIIAIVPGFGSILS